MRIILSILTVFALLNPVFAQDSPEELMDKIETLKKELKEHEAADQVPKKDVPRYLQDISVTIIAKDSHGRGGEGSGIIVTRKFPSGESVNFIWTAAHVIDNLRNTRDIIDPKSGTPKKVIEFADAKVVKGLTEDGRDVGKLELFAEVVRYSTEEDLALLRLRKRNFVTASAQFYLKDDIPPISTPLLHVGSLLGQLGANSMTTGIMSQHGRIMDKKVFDQTTVAAFPGSSGGGVYSVNGLVVGMLVRGAGETFNLIVPVRRMRKWSKQANVEWALDENVPMISEEELSKLPVEDTGVVFSYSRKVESSGNSSAPFSYRNVIIGNGRPYLGSVELENKFPTFHIWTDLTQEE